MALLACGVSAGDKRGFRGADPKDCQAQGLSWAELVECVNRDAYGKNFGGAADASPAVAPAAQPPPVRPRPPSVYLNQCMVNGQLVSSKGLCDSLPAPATAPPTGTAVPPSQPVVPAAQQPTPPVQTAQQAPRTGSRPSMLGMLMLLVLGVLAYKVYGKPAEQHRRRAAAIDSAQNRPVAGPSAPPRDRMAERPDTTRRSDDSRWARPTARQDDADAPPVWSRKLIGRLEWKRFEEVCVEYFRVLGHQADTTNFGADGGIDFKIYNQTRDKLLFLGQCKAWNGSYQVGVAQVREFYGAMKAQRIDHGIYLTSGRYTPDAQGFAAGLPEPDVLTLVDGDKFFDLIGKLPAEKRQALLAFATAGEFATPTCPKCGIKMVLRPRKNNARPIWGCPNYARRPRCRQTFVFVGDTDRDGPFAHQANNGGTRAERT